MINLYKTKKLIILPLLMVVVSLNFIACNSDDVSSTITPLTKEIIGTWKSRGKYYYFLSNGEGFYQEAKNNDGISREAYIWDVKDSVLTVKYLESSGGFSHYIVSVDDNMLSLKAIDDGHEFKWDRINRNGSTSINYKNTPYESYICVHGVYYPLLKVVSKCEHGYGGEDNSKFLQFFGTNGLLKPIGAYFFLFTPSYEGITGEWPDGTYSIRKNANYWYYGGTYCEGTWVSGCEGFLKIKTVDDMKIYDFELKGDDGRKAIGHFIGKYTIGS